MAGILDKEGKILECNHHLLQNTGYERNELIGIIGPVELVDEKDRDRAMLEFERVKTNEINLNVPILLKRKDRSVFPTIWSGSTLRDEENNILGYLLTGKDLSDIYESNKKLLLQQERQIKEKLVLIEKLEQAVSRTKDQYKELETAYERLSKMEERYQNLYDCLPDLVRSISDDGTILDCSTNYAKMLGYTKGEVIGKSIFDHTSKKSLEKLAGGLEEWKKTGEVTNQTIWMKRKDGWEFPALLSGTTAYDDKGRMVGRIVSLKDMTEIYEAKEELETERAKRLMTIGEITSRFTHDIRNPLAIIHNATELLKIKNQGNREIEIPVFDMIDRAISRISSQVDDILNFVRSTDIKKESCSLLEVIHSSLGKIRMSDNIAVILPEDDLQVYCDKVKLELILENLITNAIQAIDASKGTITIKVENKAGYDTVAVSDSGPGIPHDILPQIFEPLFTTKRSGTGLGLPTCKNLAEQHGWTIEVKLPSTFIIRMPHRE
ncbi:MAG: PAS domain S-box protein [Thaumarchaeota archaeon]|nr:PAS domain S-box protein [Nitrososphaerota archaeon]